MANVKKGNLTQASEWWQHLRNFGKREFWKGERKAYKEVIQKELVEVKRVRAIDRRPKTDIDGNTVWPDSTTSE